MGDIDPSQDRIREQPMSSHEGRVRNRREQAIIELVAEGLTNREIARALGATEYAIKNDLKAVYDKLGLSNRVELALWHETRQHESRKGSSTS